MVAVRTLAAMAVLAAVALPPARARAILLVPSGSPVGSAMDTLTVNGTYSGLTPPLAQPFAAAAFQLTLTLPAEVAINATGFANFSTTASGSYANGGQTEHFSNAPVFFGANGSNPGFSLQVSSFLVPHDFFDLSAATASDLYMPVVLASALDQGGQDYQLITRSYSVTGLASYAGDPSFTGSITVATGVPEPASWAILPAGLLALGAAAARRGRRV